MLVWSNMQLYLIILGSVLSAFGSILIYQFSGMRSDIRNISQSVDKLNIQIAEVIKDQDWHKSEIKEMKERIIALESRS